MLLATVAAVVVLATALPFIRTGRWWVRVCDFPRLQLAAVGLATLAPLLARGPETAAGWLLAAALAAAVAYQSYRILPYTPLYPTTVLESRNPAPERRLRLLIANVLMGNRSRSSSASAFSPERGFIPASP